MANIINYLATNFKTFEEMPFSPVDSLVLSEFCMVELNEILADMPDAAIEANPNKRYFLPWKKKNGADFKFTDAMRAEHYHAMFKGFTTQGCKDNLLGLAASPRFRDMTIHSYRSILDHQSHIQFAATTFIYKDQFAFIGFRGTDTSIAGWREDFDMSASFPVPAQDEALHFLKQTVTRLPKKIKNIYVGGHSKGANLAVYASIFAPPAILAIILDLDAPLICIHLSVSRIPVSAYFKGLFLPVSIFNGNIICTRAPSFKSGSYKHIPIQEPNAYVTIVPDP